MRSASVLAFVALLAVATQSRAALIVEYIQVASMASPLSNGPALTQLTLDPTGPNSVAFIQVVLRDTIGSGPNGGEPPGTVNWQTNGGFGGPGSLGLGSFFVRFDGIPGVAVNPAPQNAANAQLVDLVNYGLIASGSMPPSHTNIGGLFNFGSEPGAVPDPTAQDRIALFNLRITALGAGSGTFRLRDPNPAPSMADNQLLFGCGCHLCNGCPWPIDDLIFGPNFTNTYDLPVVVTPEPSSLLLLLLASGGLYARRTSSRRGKPGGSPE